MKRTVLVCLLFLFLTLLFTFPLVFKMGSGIYGFPQFRGDPMGTMWWMWWYRHAWENGINVNFVPVIAYPFGVSFKGLPVAPLLNLPAAGLCFLIGNEILAYNLLVLAGIFLTALCAYALGKYLTGSAAGGIMTGIIFGFCPNQIMHSAQHLGFTLNFWIPLYILSLFMILRRPCASRALLCSVLCAAAALSNYYYGYFMLVFSAVFFLFWMRRGRRFVLWFLGACAGGFLLVLPFIVPIVSFHAGQGVYAHPVKDLFKYAARWYDYFLPCAFHPVFGRWTKGIVGHYFERSLYAGIVPLSLSLAAWAKNKDSAVRFFWVCAAVFFIFSISPVFRAGRFALPNLSFFAYKILPMFRVYARAGFLVILSVGILAGYGIREIRSVWARGILIFLVLFEYLNFPPFHIIDLSETPAVYKWLKNKPEGTAVVEYPFARGIEARNSEYLFYQRVHGKNLVNGAPDGSIGAGFRKEVQHLDSPKTPKLLAYLGARYVIVHKDAYKKEELDAIDKNTGLKLVNEFPEALVYRVTVKADIMPVVFCNGFGREEVWGGKGGDWRWMGDNAVLYIGADKQADVDISFNILAFAEERELKIYMGGVLLDDMRIPAVSSPSMARRAELKGIKLRAGGNIMRFYCPQGSRRIGDVLGTDDNRCVSFALSGLKVYKSNYPKGKI